VTELRRVELNMKLRRLHVQHQLLPHERLLSLSVFPLMGVGAFTDPAYSPQGPVAQSLFTPDEVIFQHKRFPYVPHTLLRYWRFLFARCFFILFSLHFFFSML
jgi:glutamate--cysteine ligase catalytic subunit